MTQTVKELDDATSADPAHVEGDDKFFLDAGTSKYRDAEAAVKGIHEKDSFIETLKSEKAQRDAELAAMRAQMAQNQAIGKLVGVQEQQANDQRMAALEARRQELREKITDNPGQMVDHVSDVVTAVESDLRRAYQDEFKKTREDFQKQLDDLRDGVDSRVQDLDPEFVARKERVTEYQQKYGMTREKAIALDKDLHPQIEYDRDIPPGHVSGRRNGASSRSNEPLVGAAERAELKAEDPTYWTDANIARLEANRRAKHKSQES